MTVDELITALDGRFDRWDVYRTHDLRWVVSCYPGEAGSLPDGGRATAGDSASMQTALEQALAYEILPTVPREPHRFSASDCKIERNGSRWWLKSPACGQFGGCGFDTKKAATAGAERWATKSQEDWSHWWATFGVIVTSGKFRWC